MSEIHTLTSLSDVNSSLRPRSADRSTLRCVTLIASMMLTATFGCREATDVPSPDANAGAGAGAEAGDQAGEGAGETGGAAGESAGDLAGADAGNAANPGAEIDRALAERVAFIETDVVPSRTYYAVGEPLTLTLRCYDQYGELTAPPELVFTPRPDEAAEVEYVAPDETTPLEDRQAVELNVTFTPRVEGQGAMRVCTRRNPDVCGRASYFVDNGPPVIELSSPQIDEVLLGADAEPQVEVAGRVSGQVALYVNEEEIDVDDDGGFSVIAPLRFGYNTIEVAADDGFRRPLTRVLRTVLYAPDTLTIASGEVSIPTPVNLRIPPAVFDGPPPPLSPAGTAPTFTDLSNSVEFLLSLLDPSALAPSDLSSGDALTLNLSGASLGQPQVDLLIQDGVIEGFMRLPDLSVTTSGLLDLDQLVFGLDGEVSVDISAFITLRPELVNGRLTLRPEGVGVALEEIRGVMEDPTAQALLDTLTSALQLALSRWASDLIEQIIEDELPRALLGQLDGILGLVSTVPFDFSQPILGLTVNGELDLTLPDNALTLSAQEGAEVTLDLTVRGPEPSANEDRPEPPPELNGVPAHPIGEIPWPANDEAGLAIPLSALNTALYLVWMQGALTLDISSVVPPPFDTLVGGVRIKAMRPPLLVDTPVGDPYPIALSVEGLILSVDSPDQTDPLDPALADDYRVSIYLPLNLALDEAAATDQLTLTASPSLRVRVALDRQGGDAPVIGPILVERSVEGLVLPQLEAAITDGLKVSIPEVSVDLGDLLSLTGVPSAEVDELVISPIVSELLRVENGWVIISAQFGFTPQ